MSDFSISNPGPLDVVNRQAQLDGVYQNRPDPTVISATATATVEDVLNGVVLCDASGGAITLTLPTATLLQAAMRDPKVGDCILFSVVESGGTNAVTVAAGTGITNDANAAALTVATTTSALYRLRISGVSTPTMDLLRFA